MRFWQLWVLLAFFLIPAWCSGATNGQYGSFLYSDNGTSVTITGYSSTSTATAVIPSTINQRPVTRIGDYAFYNSKISGVSIPKDVREIGTGAFHGCAGFKRFDIPAGVTSIEGNVFVGCVNLSFISMGQENPNYSSSQGGVLFNKTGTILIAYPPAKVGSYEIPSTVTVVGDNAFYGCERLTSVYIPSSVTMIGGDAFKYCSGLTNLTLAWKIGRMGDGAFSNCWSLRKASISGLTRIPNSAFNSCIRLESIFIPNTVTAIGNDAFANCTALKNVTIPPSVASIGSLAFFNCNNLSRVTFDGRAPSMGSQPLVGLMFGGAAGDFVIHYYDANGFSSPTWLGYPAVNMGERTQPKIWLNKWGLPYDSAMSDDPNGDGVSLLMAYALNLDPNQNLGSLLPQAELDSQGLVMSFYSGTPGITYTVETSTDMIKWGTEDVVLFKPEWSATTIATVPDPGPNRFMRLVVSQ
ncbi:leucine-rich repeat domain-containing protein [Luteolibacter yonseiensis]|uniref:Leucine-rich repeat domain-containing protein n=1 Tax=Luteolibacter yonseiensis TaxID=1144680 RepID=A0A934VC04_9BACT|nr:leucine-rich repeat domain-containing protein [Luteolibacter yonseiensis]MBK1815979.1 leucine-rich repeat domain-containing protein [Luteolibacter yonseiensis]